jgi:hypothetical protein
MVVLALVLLVVGDFLYSGMEPVWDAKWDNIMVAVLDTNLVPKWGDICHLPSMRHCCVGGILASKTGTQNAAALTLPVID